jgi:class 3 adenylate cyclase
MGALWLVRVRSGGPRARLTSSGPERERRKTVTVLFCGVTGSSSLGETVDPAALRALLARYFERMKQTAERHLCSGTVVGREGAPAGKRLPLQADGREV